MREYATVLHLHKLESSTPLGPVYEYPGSNELMVNAAWDETTMLLFSIER